jgi:hypothetical protein
MSGDAIQDIFRDLTSFKMLWGLLFLYTFLFFATAVISNIFIAIVE